jgi:hypothetical protein
MTLVRSKTIITFSATMLLVAAFVSSADARPQAKRLSPQNETVYYNSDYNTTHSQDNSCFSRSTGLPDQYACSSNSG